MKWSSYPPFPSASFRPRKAVLSSIGLLALSNVGLAHEPEPLPVTVVTGRADSLLRIADTASEGFIGRDHLDRRPLLRPGEILETVPGLLVTQHSGAGKANQFFLRGFNLDHGTDFATSLGGVPLNLPSHAHGQGYTDLNFLIPELVGTVHFRKGPSAAEVGDFGSAGAADLGYLRRLERGFATVGGGSFGYARLVAADSRKVGEGDLLYAVEGLHEDGPWTVPSDYRKVNAVVGYDRGTNERGWNVTAMAYAGEWTATDQIPSRAGIGIFDSIDPTDGGDSRRFSLQGDWHGESDRHRTHLLAYAVGYELDLYSNFTYRLASPDGDQFEQRDRRAIVGAKAAHTWIHGLGERDSETTFGLQVRSDFIENGLFSTVGRERVTKRDHAGNPIPSTTREDRLTESALAPWAENRTRWNDWLRTTAGIRADVYGVDNTSDQAVNSGRREATIASPRGGVVFGPWAETELYLGGGLGFHSNDGRGATTRMDPASGTAVTPADLLVRTTGAEVGVRTVAAPGLQSTVSLWWLDIDSELLFVGDAGATEASRPSRRFGIEFANYWTPLKWLTLDADLSVSQARFRDEDPAGDRIPGSVGTVFAAGVAVQELEMLPGFFASLRLRQFGPRALVEDGSERSRTTLLLNAQVGCRFGSRWTLTADVFNLLDRRDDDITYFYPSRLPGEVAGPDDGGYNDRHFHPVEPVSFRVALTGRF